MFNKKINNKVFKFINIVVNKFKNIYVRNINVINNNAINNMNVMNSIIAENNIHVTNTMNDMYTNNSSNNNNNINGIHAAHAANAVNIMNTVNIMNDIEIMNNMNMNINKKIYNVPNIPNNHTANNTAVNCMSNKNIKINMKKLKRKNANHTPVKFKIFSPFNFIKQQKLYEIKKFARVDTKKYNKYFSVAIVPYSSKNVKSFKISNLYLKFALAWVLFLSLSIYSISYFINI